MSKMIHDPENYWEQIERLELLIKGAELKAGIIFSFHSLILGLFFDRFDDFKHVLLESIPFAIASIIWLISALVSIYFAVKCFIPKINLEYDRNVFFFGDAVNRFENVQEYSEKLMEVCQDEKQLFRQLSEQIHVESKIINFKFIQVKKSISALAISLVAMIPVIIFGLLSVG